MSTASEKNLVLDLDGTLIDAQSAVGARSALVLGRGVPAHVCGSEFGNLRIYKRPGLDAFLEWCFENFDNVGIWTLSSKEWLYEVLDNVLPQYPREKWCFLWTGERATRLQGMRHKNEFVNMGGVGVLKDLKKIYRNKGLLRSGFTRWNTLIVEDNPSNCSRNYGNAVYVTSFDILSQHRDDELRHLKSYFEKILLPCKNVRQLEKRSWHKDMLAEETERKMQIPKSDSGAFWMTDKWKPPSFIKITARSLGI